MTLIFLISVMKKLISESYNIINHLFNQKEKPSASIW